MSKVYFNPPSNVIKTEFKYREYCGYIYDEKNSIAIVWVKAPIYDEIKQYEDIVKESYKNLKLF
jgi:hypothetical protein